VGKGKDRKVGKWEVGQMGDEKKNDGRWMRDEKKLRRAEADKVDRKKMGSRELVKVRKGQEDGRSKDKGEREKAKFDCDCVI